MCRIFHRISREHYLYYFWFYLFLGFFLGGGISILMNMSLPLNVCKPTPMVQFQIKSDIVNPCFFTLYTSPGYCILHLYTVYFTCILYTSPVYCILTQPEHTFWESPHVLFQMIQYSASFIIRNHLEMHAPICSDKRGLTAHSFVARLDVCLGLALRLLNLYSWAETFMDKIY